MVYPVDVPVNEEVSVVPFRILCQDVLPVKSEQITLVYVGQWKRHETTDLRSVSGVDVLVPLP